MESHSPHLVAAVKARLIWEAGEEDSIVPQMDGEFVDNVAAEAVEEGWFSTMDTILIGALVAVIAWYYFKGRGDSDDVPPANIHISSSPLMRTSDRSDDDSFIGKMKKSGSKVVVFYGSQTGTAEEFAGRLAKDATRYGLKSMVADPEEFDMNDIAQLPAEIEDHLAIFCMATYGEGDPTDNAAEFYQMLIDQELDLANLNYCVFALGNKTYEHYNATGRYVNKRLEELGANCIYPIGEGDDDANMEDDFITWKDEMWPKVCEFFGLDAAGQDINMRQYSLTELTDPDPSKIFTGEITRLKAHLPEKQRPPFDVKNPFMSQILVNRELHKGGNRNCLHIELDITDSKIRYDAGDHVAVYPCNNSDLVEGLCSMMGKDPEKVFLLTNLDEYSSKKSPFPCPCSYRTALSYYVDITSPPRTHVLKEFIQYTTEEKDKAHLTLLTSTTEEGRAAYQDWIVKSARTISHVLQDLPSCRPPLDYVCELLPRLQARYYSISSSPKAHPTCVHVTAVVLQYQTSTQRINKGVATNWLMAQKPTEDKQYKVPIFVRKSQFRLPIKSTVPVVMIGPGTGIAPFRGFLQERELAFKRDGSIGKTLLYFGCRHKDQDYIYQEELEQYEASGLVTLRVAFSRDQPQKVYVQHLLAQDATLFWDLVGKQKGHVYVCGDAKNMAREVQATIIDICKTEGSMTQQQAEDYVKTMIQKKRYSSDVWS
ncbi:NADPH-cytochrome P450 reductase [Trinorchestia longiramus]|nr:NADPH-cytochrome P450 reductase [Trinorchestia longiramus]